MDTVEHLVENVLRTDPSTEDFRIKRRGNGQAKEKKDYRPCDDVQCSRDEDSTEKVDFPFVEVDTEEAVFEKPRLRKKEKGTQYQCLYEVTAAMPIGEGFIH